VGSRKDQGPQQLRTRAADFPVSLRRKLQGQKYFKFHLGLCVITFLPNLLDSNEQEYAVYFEKIKEVGLKFRGKPYKFLWTQGGDHFDFEEKIGAVGVGYPVVTVIYEAKKYYGKLRKAFSVENFENYLTDILGNKVRMNKLPPLDPLKEVQAYVHPEASGEEAYAG
jgi:hypothetical protein